MQYLLRQPGKACLPDCCACLFARHTAVAGMVEQPTHTEAAHVIFGEVRPKELDQREGVTVAFAGLEAMPVPIVIDDQRALAADPDLVVAAALNPRSR